MEQHEIKPLQPKKSRKRVGRGDASGYGSYSGRGIKGQNSRSGGGVRPGFEGGQLPLFRRLPRIRGFTNIFRTEYSVVNVGRLDDFENGTEITPELLVKVGLVKKSKSLIKILGSGDLSKSLNVVAHNFSESAKKKIESAGGKIEELK
ncbi:MAG: 50S ribosomal protein L15 [Dehalococcoidia bacterium]